MKIVTVPSTITEVWRTKDGLFLVVTVDDTEAVNDGVIVVAIQIGEQTAKTLLKYLDYIEDEYVEFLD